MALRILLAGGGTGGHVYPLVAVAEELKKQAAQSNKSIELRMMGDGDLIRQVAGELGIPFSRVPSSKWRRYFSVWNFVDAIKFPFGFLLALIKVWLFMPDAIFSKGGHGGFLPALAGRLLFIPIIIHDSDAVPGRANRFLGKFAKRVCVNFESAVAYFPVGKTEVTGEPLRSAVLQKYDKAQALATFGFSSEGGSASGGDPSRPTVFITGAGQGSQIINDTIMAGLVELMKQYQVIHQCGPKHFDSMTKRLEQVEKEEPAVAEMIRKSYKLFAVLTAEQMAQAYSASDVVVSRSGSGIFEIAASGKPAIVIPLASAANNHQLINAQEFAKFGATVITEDNLKPHLLLYEIGQVYAHRDEIASKISQFARPDAANTIAGLLL